MKRVRKILIFLLVFLFTLSPFNLNNFADSLGAFASIENISGTVVWSEDRIVENEVRVPSGATLIIERGTTISFTNHAKLSISGGELIVSGTVKDPVKFKAGDSSGEGYSIYASAGGKITMRNADVQDGGNAIYLVESNNPLLNSAYAAEYFGAIYINNGTLEVQSSHIHDNVVGVYVKNSNESDIRVNRTRFANNLNYDVISGFSSGKGPDFRYNWWDSENGPPKVVYPTYTQYEKISGKIDFSNWLEKENFRDPVIIVPGIMGSWEVNGEWKLDPILHSYENIYNKLIEEGYEPNKNLFKFPYQWRNSNVENARLLQDAITTIKTQENWPKIDIIAHSMGGLLAREYIESSYYNNDVDQLITVGTPHKGAPKAYIMWEAGEFTDLFGFIGKAILTREAKKAGYENLFHYIRNIPSIREHPIQSVQELLPTYSYIFDLDLNSPRLYPNGYPQNTFLESLNNPSRLKNLLKVENDVIYGKINRENTISAFEVINAPAFGEYWEHGYPQNYYNLIWGEEGVVYGKGDETVPVLSATGIDADYKIEVSAGHNDLTTEAQKDIVELLTGNRPNTEVRDASLDIREALLVQVYCPVDVSVIDPVGNVYGKDQENLGVAYINNGDNEEFLVIPNPREGEYKILVEGTGTGEYEIEIARFRKNESNVQLAEKSEVTVEGVAELGSKDEEIIKLEEGKVLLSSDTTPPSITIASPEDQKTYLNDQIIPVSYEITDDVSAPEKVAKIVEYDGNPFAENQIDLSLEHLGNHIFKITAADEAENSADKEINFRVTTNLSAIQNNLKHYFDLGFIKKEIAYKYFNKELKNLEKLFNLLEKLENSEMESKSKQIAIDKLKKVINADIDRIIRQINQKSPQWIDQKARGLLIESLGAIKIS